MFRNYLKLAWRNLGKHKVDTAINLVGLCVAFTAALLLFLSVFFEFSYDNFHENGKQLYHVYTKVYRVNGVQNSSTVPVPMIPALKESYPEIQYASRYVSKNGNVRYMEKQLTQNLRITDPDFFRMFSFPFLKGSPQTALNDLNSLVLTRKSAAAIFGKEEDPIGKIVQMQVGSQWKPFTVTGVTADIPENSSITFDMVGRFETDENYNARINDWESWNHNAYVQLKQGASPDALVKKTAAFFDQYFKEDYNGLKRDGAKPAADGSYIQLGLLPLKDMHTETAMLVEGGNVSRSYLYLLLAIGVLILLIACINFINLTIGRSFTRSHEIGLRKTLGALRGQIIAQLWVEALLICFFALVVSGVLSYILLPPYKQLFALHVERDVLFSPVVWAGVLAGFFLITLVAGGYPAWLISRVNIVSILKGKFSIARSQGIRNTLIVVQFSIAVLLLICTIISWQQIDYLRNKPLGYNRAQVISVPVEGDQDPALVLERLREKLSGYPTIKSISGIYNNLGRGLDGSSRHSTVGFDYKNRGISTGWLGVSYDFVKTLDLQLVAGRDFSRDFPTDSNAMVINEAMARQLEEKNVIGLQLLARDSAHPVTVIGVVKDFNYESLQKKIEPMSFVLEKDFPAHYALVKVASANLPASMELVKNTWKQILPNSDFKGSFLDENIDRQYKKEEKLSQIFVSCAVIAIVLSCLGLLAMVILIVTQKIKEIGIRKVLGASVGNIVFLVSKEFFWLVAIAIIIASPLAWFGMQKWLDNFAYRISIAWWVFVLAGLLAFVVALCTISIQAIKAATANPVKSLRTE
ncbi:ABC transporter permease [Flavisolibacter nicotianae]|uniref:ABC transporter permease n=1 Tax=Flavisolibacter nicotianae TaxID=2364882 RepID=UPI000EAC4CC5|nr:ABC transporter permease [Flavisolibacter nicotianae]